MLSFRIVRHSRGAPGGFTLLELLIVVILISIFSAIIIPSFLSLVNREKVNSVALGLAGWIESVRNYAARQISADPSAAGCAIKFLPTSSATAGTIIAQIDSSAGGGCQMPLNEQSYRVPSDIGASFSFAAVNQLGTPNNSLIFTPRGIWISNPASSGPLILKIVQNGVGPMRCLKTSEFLGDLEIGSINAKVITSVCDSYAAF